VELGLVRHLLVQVHAVGRSIDETRDSAGAVRRDPDEDDVRARRGSVTTVLSEVADLGRARVLCIGDAVLDRFAFGGARRISPEAPVPVLRVLRSESMPGGAGNVARNVVSLGATCTLVTVVGGDPAGAELRSLLGEVPGLRCEAVVDEGRSTPVKTRFVAEGQQLLRVDHEDDVEVAGEVAAGLVALAEGLVGAADVVVLSDYAKGTLSAAVTAAVIAAARAAGLPVVVDPKGRDYARYAGATLVTPNVKELHEVTGIEAATDDAVEQAAGALLAEVDVGAVLVTRSERGMSYIPRGGRAVHLPTRAQEVFDISGAGDTVVAALAAALAVGLEPPRAAQLANLAAGVVVGKVGTASVTPAELVDASRRLEQGTLPGLRDLDAVAALVERWRAEGASVGFTNGCFDLVHPGHVSLLVQAAARCDRLVVGLNSDASVERLKGAGRPVVPEGDRAEILAALRGVDAVVLFDEDTPEALIRRFRPDVLVKGADYSEDEVVGAEFVKSYGGTVFLADLVPGRSTTDLVERIGS
jgi:D-beta-D-heptose 7-phosphate kinase/D-beta-D-heptose 1-phosphate adenosyltransferase